MGESLSKSGGFGSGKLTRLHETQTSMAVTCSFPCLIHHCVLSTRTTIALSLGMISNPFSVEDGLHNPNSPICCSLSTGWSTSSLTITISVSVYHWFCFISFGRFPATMVVGSGPLVASLTRYICFLALTIYGCKNHYHTHNYYP